MIKNKKVVNVIIFALLLVTVIFTVAAFKAQAKQTALINSAMGIY